MKKYKKLSGSELEVMIIIWNEKEQISTGDILRKIDKEIKIQTLQIFLNRLKNKGFITCEKIGRYNYYQALVKEEDYREQETNSFVKKFYKNSSVDLIVTLVKDEHLTKEQIETIKKILSKGEEGL